MRRFEEIGEAFIFLFKDYPQEIKSEVRNTLNNYEFVRRKKGEPPHPNSITESSCSAPSTYIEAIMKIMHPYYNATTANNVRKYIIENL